MNVNSRPLIVTARLDPVTQGYFDELRTQHFPPERNHLSAHLTMFHALPGDSIEDVNVVLTNAATRNDVFSAEVCNLRSLGNGVAFTIRSADLERVRQEIAAAFRSQLTKQDAQRWRPHITIQNKVTRESAQELMASLQRTFQPWSVSIEGLDLWYYDGGPWEFVQGVRFGISP